LFGDDQRQFSSFHPEICFMDENYLTPHVFTRHKLHLHALLLQNQPWFNARDLGRLLRIHLNDRQLRKLDPDQHQTAKTFIYGNIENTLLVSESGVYALLVYHYCPEYRALREWLTHEIVPALRDTTANRLLFVLILRYASIVDELKVYG
jgi:prophage antirepressor-like protein